jgi:hypothetical protein
MNRCWNERPELNRRETRDVRRSQAIDDGIWRTHATGNGTPGFKRSAIAGSDRTRCRDIHFEAQRHIGQTRLLCAMDAAEPNPTAYAIEHDRFIIDLGP